MNAKRSGRYCTCYSGRYNHKHTILCAIPPYMLESIARNGTVAQQVFAMHNITMAAQMRGERQVVSDYEFLSLTNDTQTKVRAVYNAQETGNLPGILMRREGGPPSGDAAVDEAYDGAGATYDLFWDIYGRNSLDDEGLQLDSTVHYQKGYDNAFWNGQQMVYGDGDEDVPLEQQLFTRFTRSIDIIGHELTHGVIQYTANLNYWGQSGALNESFADVFGVLVRQRVFNHTAAEADWLIGADLLSPNVNGRGVRSMSAPGTAYDDEVLGVDPQPGHMDDFKDVDYDNGGVHINSGIPNRAFYVTAREIGGFAWEKAGKIWYATLTDRLKANSTFREAAEATYAAAGSLYGQGSLEQKAVFTGWQTVGIEIAQTTPPPVEPPKEPETPQKPPPPPSPEPQGCFDGVLGVIGLMRRPPS